MANSAPWAAALLVLAAVTYANALDGPFLFDDRAAIVENHSIRGLRLSLDPPRDTPVAGRPLANLSFALNYALGGLEVRGYHLVNIGLHGLCGVLLFALVGRTRRAVLKGRERALEERTLAFLAAALWIVHPLASEPVDYLTQRTEQLVALFYLLTLYATSRAAASSARYAQRWVAAAVAACSLGMLSKEVMVTAPLVVLLYDASYLAGSLRGALRQRRVLYTLLALTWAIVAVMAMGGTREASVGADLGVSPWGYLLNQLWVVLSYLRTAVWPHPLILDYGWPLAVGPGGVWAEGLALAGLITASLWLQWRHPHWGFPFVAALWVLVPTSSLLPIATEVGAERRMYLPLAALSSVFVISSWSALVRLAGRRVASGIGPALISLLLVACIGATRARNREYRSERVLWASAVAAMPSNPRGVLNLGAALLDEGDDAEAERRIRTALRMRPAYPRAYALLGRMSQQRGDLEEAEAHYRKTVEMDPRQTQIQTNLGALLSNQGRTREAVEQWRDALRKDPTLIFAANNLAWVYATTRDGDLRNGEEALRLALYANRATAGSMPEILATLGAAYAELGRWPEAIETTTRGAQLASKGGGEALAEELDARARRFERLREPLRE